MKIRHLYEAWRYLVPLTKATVYTHIGGELEILHYPPQSPLHKGGSSSSPPYEGGVRGGEATANASFQYLCVHRSLTKGNRQGGVPISAQTIEDPSAFGISPCQGENLGQPFHVEDFIYVQLPNQPIWKLDIEP